MMNNLLELISPDIDNFAYFYVDHTLSVNRAGENYKLASQVGGMWIARLFSVGLG